MSNVFKIIKNFERKSIEQQFKDDIENKENKVEEIVNNEENISLTKDETVEESNIEIKKPKEKKNVRNRSIKRKNEGAVGKSNGSKVPKKGKENIHR